MPIHKLFHYAYILTQTAADDEVPNAAITACVDNGGTLILGQEGRDICLSMETVDDLCKLVRTVRDGYGRGRDALV